MKNFRILPALLIIVSINLKGIAQETQNNEKYYTDWVSYVNPLMGTDSEFELSNGNTYPAIARPWGMNFWTPQTAKM
jgi:putative alpha-1,2-mannosidase